MQALFGTAGLEVWWWLLITGLPSAKFLLVELGKAVLRGFGVRRTCADLGLRPECSNQNLHFLGMSRGNAQFFLLHRNLIADIAEPHV